MHYRHTINDMRVNEEIYLNIIRSKKQQQYHCRYPCDSMFFTFHAAKVQRIFGTAKFLAKKMYRSYHFDKECANFLQHFLFIGEGSYLYRLLSRRYYRRIAHLRIGDGCCLSGVQAPAYCLLAADSICRNLKDLLPRLRLLQQASSFFSRFNGQSPTTH